MKRLLFTLKLIGILSISFTQTNPLLTNPTTGNPTSSAPIYDFEFVYLNNNLVLAYGSYNTGKIYAIDFNSSTSTGVHNWELNNVTAIKSKISSITGISTSNLRIRDMEVNPKTKAVVMLMQNTSTNITFLIEVKNPTSISVVNLSSVTYSAVNYTTTNNYIFDMEWASNGKLYYTTGDFTLAARIGEITPPFVHNSTATLQATTLFKSNWGGSYYTNAPLEMISYTTINGIGRLTGVTTCAPGFSIPVSTINNGFSLLSVTEDFNVRNDPPIKVVTLTKVINGIEQSYLFDLHSNSTNPGPNQLIRIGKKYLDGSRIPANEFNIRAKEIRTTTGLMTPGQAITDALEISKGFEMISKYSESYLMVVDNNGILRLMDANGSYASIVEEQKEKISFTVYPSPARNFINIKLKENNQSILTLGIFDISGKKVLEGATTSGPIDISIMESGIYFINIYKDEIKVGSQKFIKN